MDRDLGGRNRDESLGRMAAGDLPLRGDGGSCCSECVATPPRAIESSATRGWRAKVRRGPPIATMDAWHLGTRFSTTRSSFPGRNGRKIARTLIASLDEPADDESESAWLVEVERRVQDLERGAAGVETWDAVRNRIAVRLRATRK